MIAPRPERLPLLDARRVAVKAGSRVLVRRDGSLDARRLARLMAAWSAAFARVKTPIAQVLLTHDDVRNRSRHPNAHATFE